MRNNINFAFALILVGLFVNACSIDRTILPLDNIEIETLAEFKSLESQNQVQIAPENEPGQKLWLCLTLVSAENKEPLPNQKIHLYHTSSVGEYEPSDPTDESTARLNASVFTDEKGRIFVRTILPGDYGRSEDNRHIHTTVENARPEAYDIHFKRYTSRMSHNFISGSYQHFLADLKQTADSTFVTFLTIVIKSPENNKGISHQQELDCEWCGAKEAPENTTWESTIADNRVVGERLILEGIIYEADGETPAENVIVYAYHTNQEGFYEKKGNETGNGLRHGYLRGWAKTNREGKYRFHTIKPGPYPNHSEPAHIHMTLMRAEFDEYWIDATWFKGDNRITAEMINKSKHIGGNSNIIELTRDENDIWVGKRDIILNPPK
ncbi:MAG: hypothetical protein KDC34_09425 [Saprospiraceae bacterium]|nr:hypothetical protein [Saprospiraceae bacterium]